MRRTGLDYALQEWQILLRNIFRQVDVYREAVNSRRILRACLRYADAKPIRGQSTCVKELMDVIGNAAAERCTQKLERSWAGIISSAGKCLVDNDLVRPDFDCEFDVRDVSHGGRSASRYQN